MASYEVVATSTHISLSYTARIRMAKKKVNRAKENRRDN
jgi:hypothetical protein